MAASADRAGARSGLRSPRRRRALTLLAGALAAPALLRPARAQGAYPDRPIRLVVPFAPGGGFDAIGRLWAERVRTALGSIVVENIAGGGSSLGAANVARAQPDGYTLLLAGSGALVVNPLASTRKLYDPVADFEPISLAAIHCFALAVHPSLPVTSLAQLLDHARAHSDTMAYGSAGTGSLNHLTGELFKSLTGLDKLLHIPYRGAGPAMNDLISGHVPMIVPSMNGQMIELHRAGKARILAVTSPQRLKGAPDIATAVEGGVAGMVSQNYVGLFAPAHTPPEIVARIVQANETALVDPRWASQLEASGFEAVPDMSPTHAGAVLKGELARWAPVIRSIGLKLD
ncbi:MAG: tripartite tricarboxylate transporter substrate binding protein [Variibacter sp.]|nr:tripartite tricarboxylate transporter substrate binding protein [Variibacter sp.]